MKRPVVIILVVSVVFTALLAWYDYTHDVPSAPYTTQMYVEEILLTGSLFTGVFFMLFYAVYTLITELRK